MYHTWGLKIEAIHTPIVSPSLTPTSPPSYYLPFSQHIPLILYPSSVHTAKLSHVAEQNVHFVHILTRRDTRVPVEKAHT